MVTDEQLDAVIAAYAMPGSGDTNRETVLALARELKAARAELKALRASGPVQIVSAAILDTPEAGV